MTLTDARRVNHAISVMTSTLKAARYVHTHLLTIVLLRGTLVDVTARPLIRAEEVSWRAGAHEAARSVTALVRTLFNQSVYLSRKKTRQYNK